MNRVLVRILRLEAQALELMRALTLPSEWRTRVMHIAETLLQREQTSPSVDPATIEAKLQRLARTYNDGLISDNEYERERDRRARVLMARCLLLPGCCCYTVATNVATLGEENVSDRRTRTQEPDQRSCPARARR